MADLFRFFQIFDRLLAPAIRKRGAGLVNGHDENLGKVDVRRTGGGPDDFLGNIFSCDCRAIVREGK